MIATEMAVPFKTVKLGLCKTADQYRKALRKAGCELSRVAEAVLDIPDFTCAVEETELYLVNLSALDLGFNGVVSYGELLHSAPAMGLSLCPPEVGPALRLAYDDQLNGEWLVIAMRGICNPIGDLFAFGVGCDDGRLWLDTWNAQPGDLWYPYRRFVFVRPR
jgi:hypothetical protein